MTLHQQIEDTLHHAERTLDRIDAWLSPKVCDTCDTRMGESHPCHTVCLWGFADGTICDLPAFHDGHDNHRS